MIRDYYEEAPDGEPPGVLFDDKASVRSDMAERQQNRSQAVPAMPNAASRGSHVSATPIIHELPTREETNVFLSPEMSDSAFEDGIFLPGTEYHELHAALRSRLIDTARSTQVSRLGTPETDDQAHIPIRDTLPDSELDGEEETWRLAHLSPEQEFILWQNYITEVAAWMDKFDYDRHFELVLPMLAKAHSHLKYAILALSARQMERYEKKADYSSSLALYAHAIHLLSPQLQRRTTAVLASCVVLAVLEMLSCSPKAWRRHLDGCAALIQALGLSGSSGGLEQALFWTFARMDICGGLISLERTLMPMHNWMGGVDVLADVAALRLQRRFDMYANQMVYLGGRVIDLLCSSGRWEQRHQRRSNILDGVDYNNDWSQLFELVESWYQFRPEEMKPILIIPSPDQLVNQPFPVLLFGSGAAISGNQLYHTSALLLLKHKPAHIHFSQKPNSMLWHARQICGISMSNEHHGAWTNSTQPLWIAGQHMSHPSEHKAILKIYARIERETGWATKWRMDDLREFWGDLNV